MFRIRVLVHRAKCCAIVVASLLLHAIIFVFFSPAYTPNAHTHTVQCSHERNYIILLVVLCVHFPSSLLDDSFFGLFSFSFGACSLSFCICHAALPPPPLVDLCLSASFIPKNTVMQRFQMYTFSNIATYRSQFEVGSVQCTMYN